MRATVCEFYLCVNPDAILNPDYVERLVESLRAHPEAGYASGLIYFCDSDGAPSEKIFSAGHWFLRNRAVLNRYIGNVRSEEEIHSGWVGGASGCAPLYRRSMLESIDLGEGEFFDADYFMYYEDIDLDWRAHLAGWKCRFEKSAIALHQSEATGGASDPTIAGQIIGNRWLTILKNDTFCNFLLHLPFILNSDLKHFWPTLRRLGGGAKDVFPGLGLRTRRAWRKRKVIRKRAKASPRDIRQWMRESLIELHKYNRQESKNG